MNLKFYQKLQKELQEKQAQLVAVTKYSPVEEINTAIKQGINKIGENRVESLEEKIKNLLPVEKHFIGVIQSQKIRKIINLFDVIQSVSSLKHLQKINRIAEEENKTIRIFLQFNISKETQKSGFNFSDLNNLKTEIKNLKNIKTEGIMGMAEFTSETKKIHEQFRLAKKIWNQLKKNISSITELSLGMSSDYQIALEEGATLIRIGKKLFL